MWQMTVTKIGTTTQSIGLQIGDDRQIFTPGVYTFVTATAANVNVDADGWLRRSTSSRRYKTDIRTMPMQSAFVDSLRPVLYRPIEGAGDTSRDAVGFIAEEVLEAGGRDFVTFGRNGEVESVQYDRLTTVLVLEVQQLRKRVSDLEARMN
jgi:hypothetical protein